MTGGPASDVRGRRAVGLVVAAAACWSTLGVLGRWAFARGIAPQTAVLWRTLLAAALGAGLLAIGWRPRLADLRRGVRVVAPLGFVVALNYSTFFHGVALLGVSVAIALFYAYPALTAAAARWLLGERLTATKTAALAASLAGCVLVSGAVEGTMGLASAAGTALVLLSAASYAAYTVGMKRAVAVLPPAAAHVGALCTAVPWLALAAWLVDRGPAPPRELAAWGLVAALAIVPTLVGYYLFARGLKSLEASTAAIVSTAEPAFAILLALVLLGESVSPLQSVGMALILGAAVIVRWTARRPPPVA